MLRRSLLAMLGILTWSTGMAHACSCILPSNGHGCNKSWISDGLVFAGTVTSKTLVEESQDSGGAARVVSRYAVRFSTVEMFHGNPANDQELVVYTGLGGGDCGYPFAVGVRYLVDASTWNGRLGTGICSFTSPEVTASGVIKELRSLRDTGRADDLFGIISEAPKGVRYEDRTNARPLAGVSIRLMSSRGRGLFGHYGHSWYLQLSDASTWRLSTRTRSSRRTGKELQRTYFGGGKRPRWTRRWLPGRCLCSSGWRDRWHCCRWQWQAFGRLRNLGTN